MTEDDLAGARPLQYLTRPEALRMILGLQSWADSTSLVLPPPDALFGRFPGWLPDTIHDYAQAIRATARPVQRTQLRARLRARRPDGQPRTVAEFASPQDAAAAQDDAQWVEVHAPDLIGSGPEWRWQRWPIETPLLDSADGWPLLDEQASEADS